MDKVKHPRQPKSDKDKFTESRGAKNSKLSKERMFKYNEALFWTLLHFNKSMNAVLKVPRKIQRKTYQGFTIELLSDQRGIFYNARRDYVMVMNGDEGKLAHTPNNYMPIEKENKDIEFSFSDMKQYLVIKSSGMLYDQLQYFVGNESFMKELEGGSTVVKERNPFGFKQSKNLPVLRRGQIKGIISKFDYFENESRMLHAAFLQQFYGNKNDRFEYFVIANQQKDCEELVNQMDRRNGNITAKFGFFQKANFMKNIERCIYEWEKNPAALLKLEEEENEENQSVTEEDLPLQSIRNEKYIQQMSNTNINELHIPLNINNNGNNINNINNLNNGNSVNENGNNENGNDGIVNPFMPLKPPTQINPLKKQNMLPMPLTIQSGQNVLNVQNGQNSQHLSFIQSNQNSQNNPRSPQSKKPKRTPRTNSQYDGTFDFNEYKHVVNELMSSLKIYKSVVPFPKE